VSQNVVNMWDVEEVYFDCCLYTFTALLALMTYYSLRSAYIITSFVVFPVFFRVVLWKLCRTASNGNLFHSTVACAN